MENIMEKDNSDILDDSDIEILFNIKKGSNLATDNIFIILKFHFNNFLQNHKDIKNGLFDNLSKIKMKWKKKVSYFYIVSIIGFLQKRNE